MSRVLRAVRHLREAATKFTFCITVQSLKIKLGEPAVVVVDLTRGPRRVRGSATIELAKGDNEINLNIPLQCNATLFKPKGSPESSSSLKRSKSRVDPAAEAAAPGIAGADGSLFLPKKAELQLVDISKSRRLGGRLLPRVRPSPSVSSSSVLPRDHSAVAPVSLSPETAVDTRETGIVVAGASFDLASLVAAHKTGTNTQSLELPLTKTSGHFVISFSCTKLEGLIADEEDCLSVCSALVSPPPNTRLSHVQATEAEASPNPQPSAGTKRSLTPAAAAALLAGVEAAQPTVLRLPHKDTLPSSLEMPTFEETAPKQQRQEAAATPAVNDGAAKTPSIEKLQRPLQEVVSTGTATTPAELSPAESQRQQRQQTQQPQQQQQQQQAELRQKDELIASLQRQVALMEAEDRHMTNPQLAQLFAQIDELHTALAAAQEQQLAAAEQLQKVREKGDGSAATAALQQQLHAAEQRLQQQEQQIRELTLQQQEMQQKSCEQQQQLLQLQAERDGMQLIADAYKKQLEEVHKQLQHQPPHTLQEERMVILLQKVKQQEQEIQQLQNKLDYETREKYTAQNEVRLLQRQLHEQQQLQHTKGNSDSASILQEQIISLQRQVVEASEMRESLRVSKDQTIGDLRKALQEMQQKQGETQSVHQQALQKLNASREEAEALREKIRCQEETLQRLPTQAAWSCAQQQHQMLLQQQREWQHQQQQQQRQQEFELAAKAKRIEELEKELVHAKVELAAAEQRRHEDIDAFKKKLQAVKETVVAYAAASSSSLQAQSSPNSGREANPNSSSRHSGNSNEKNSPVKRLVHISILKALFRSGTSSRQPYSRSRSNSSHFAPNAATEMRPSGASANICAQHSYSMSRGLNDRSSNSVATSGSSSSSSCKGPSASVSLFGNQPLGVVSKGSSVTRFCASKGGGCSVISSSVP